MFHFLQMAVSEAVQTLRGNVLRTLLSTLGIIIGVAALVGILALGDGMEKFGREQVASTSDLNSILVIPNGGEKLDGIWVKKDDLAPIRPESVTVLGQSLPHPARIEMSSEWRGIIRVADDTLKWPAQVSACLETKFTAKTEVAHGRIFAREDIAARDSVMVLNAHLAEKLTTGDPATLLNKRLRFQEKTFRVLGILAKNDRDKVPQAFFPISVLSDGEYREKPPGLVVTADKTEDVPAIKNSVKQWLDGNIKRGKEDYEVITNDYRVEQMRKGILVFKTVMGMIVGIAILVGGIGIMNVLLMSVTERTREIGIRKAIGAKPSAIALQFVAESLVITALGCIVGLLVGIGFMKIAAPIIRQVTEIKEFNTAFSAGSFLVIALVAVLVGVGFGVAPAWKAARLSPVDAMRHE
jgi:putative ABC transport system permease protein